MSVPMELVSRRGDDVTLADSQWGDACREIDRLVGAEDVGPLDAIRGAAAAHELYERRRKNRAGEERYARLRLLSESGIGVLSFGKPDVVKVSERGRFRLLAAAYERGELLEAASRARSLSMSAVAEVCRAEGYGYVPAYKISRELRGSVPWIEARALARERGVSLLGLPCDPRVARQEQERRRKRGLELTQAYAARRKRTREANRKDIARGAAEFGAGLDIVYAHLRRTINALDDSFGRLKEEGRRDFNHKHRYDAMFEYLYRAEDQLTCLLGEGRRVFSRRDDSVESYW